MMVEFNDRRESKFIVKAGDDDRNATRHAIIQEAEETAVERSKNTWHKTAYIHRISGQMTRRYQDGELTGFLGNTDGSDTHKWIDI